MILQKGDGNWPSQESPEAGIVSGWPLAQQAGEPERLRNYWDAETKGYMDLQADMTFQGRYDQDK